MSDEKLDRMWQVIKFICGKMPPKKLRDKFPISDPDDNGDTFLELQGWVASNHKLPDWATGIAILEGCEAIAKSSL